MGWRDRSGRSPALSGCNEAGPLLGVAIRRAILEGLEAAWLFLPARVGGGSRRPRDFTTRDSRSYLDQFAADWDGPFLENGWNVAPLTNHGDNRDESLSDLRSLTPPSQEAGPNVFIAFAVLLLIAEVWSDRTLGCGGVSGMSKLPPLWPCSGHLKEWQMASLPCTLSHSLGATSVLTPVECRDRKGGINDLA